MISDAKPSEGSPPSYSAPSVSELGSSSTPINRNQQAQLPPLPEKQAHPTSLADLGKDYQAQRRSRPIYYSSGYLIVISQFSHNAHWGIIKLQDSMECAGLSLLFSYSLLG